MGRGTLAYIPDEEWFGLGTLAKILEAATAKCTLQETATREAADLAFKLLSPKAAYVKLSKCNRRYIQQFLSGQGLYNSTIDGKWGAGTASAIQKAKNLGKLKGKSSAQIIQQLSQNPVCD